MMRRSEVGISLVAGWLLAGSAAGDPVVRTWLDPVGDAVPRRMDLGNDASLRPDTVLPDVVSVSICGWVPSNPVIDPYIGEAVPAGFAHFLRLEVVLAGLVNPPGSLGDGLPQSWDPFRFGPSPFYGTISFDVDNDLNTGGILGGDSLRTYLANVGRFGVVARGPLATRTLIYAPDEDLDFFTEPMFEWSGDDYELAFCGCEAPIIVWQTGDNDGFFEAGETWSVKGRFFRRATGYQDASFVFSDSADGMYDPLVSLRFSHSQASNRTTISLVYQLTMNGAAQLVGSTIEQPMDFTLSSSNHHSVVEALNDVIERVSAPPPPTGPAGVLSAGWIGRNAAAYLNPLAWNAHILVGTAPEFHDPSAEVVWTDAGFDEVAGDLDGDGDSDLDDRTAVQETISAIDGGSLDTDGAVNGQVGIQSFAFRFNAHDANYDGTLDQNDVGMVGGSCLAEWDGTAGLTTLDLFAFITDFLNGAADVDGSGATDSLDFFVYLVAFFNGCP